MPSRTDTPRDLLFGLLALQTGLIDQTGLVVAFLAWTRARDRPMGEILVEQGVIDDDQRSLIDGLAAHHLKKHGGDAERSLAALAAGPSTREKLAAIADPDLDASLATVGPAAETDDDPYRTASHAVGSATSDGQRFRVLRPHARGGLGEVFVALDAELNREVALKEILEHHAAPRALAEDIERWAADAPVTAYREPIARRARRHRAAVTAASAGILAALIVLAGVLAVQSQADRDLKSKNDELTEANRRAIQANADLKAAIARVSRANVDLEMANDRVQARFDRARESIHAIQATATGDRILEDQRFHALRRRPDFQALLMDLAFPDDPFPPIAGSPKAGQSSR